jgi:hypothetical protein
MADRESGTPEDEWSMRSLFVASYVPLLGAAGVYALLRVLWALWTGDVSVSERHMPQYTVRAADDPARYWGTLFFLVLFGSLMVLNAAITVARWRAQAASGQPWSVILNRWADRFAPRAKTSRAGNVLAWILLVPLVLIVAAALLALALGPP